MRKRKRALDVAKRCDCRNQQKCHHPWWLRIKVNTVRQRINITALFPDDAIDVAAAKAADLARHGKIVGGRPIAAAGTKVTVRYVADEYMKADPERRLEYLRAMLEISVPPGVKLGDKPMDEVSTRDIREVGKVWGQRPTCGPNAIRHLLQSARHFFGWAVKQEYCERTPFKSVDGNPLIPVPKSTSRDRRLEEGEEERILTVADAYMRDFFVAMLNTGCRPGELRELQWSEVSLSRIVVLKEKAKTGKERRIPILPDLREILDRRQLAPDGSKLPDDAYVFGDDTGRVLSRERLCERWRIVCKAAKVKNLHLHDLRGEFASQLAEASIPIHEIRDALGHANTSMTSVYLRSRTDTLDITYGQLDTARKLKLVKGSTKGPQHATAVNE